MPPSSNIVLWMQTVKEQRSISNQCSLCILSSSTGKTGMNWKRKCLVILHNWMTIDQPLKFKNKPKGLCSLGQVIEIFYAPFPCWKPYNAQRSILSMIDGWLWKLQKSAGWLQVHEIWEMYQPLHKCAINFANSSTMCLWRRTKGFVTCLCNNFQNMGRQLSRFLTPQTFRPRKA